MNWRDHLRDRLLALRPASVCALDPAAHRFVERVLPGVPCHAPDAQPPVPCELALGIDALDGLDDRSAAALIARIRTYAAPRLLLVASPACTLDADAFRALGFALSQDDTAADIRVHFYDIATYKTVPDWLNARFWANPERWTP